jgi:uncharacterized RDD family membrane protein YckC
VDLVHLDLTAAPAKMPLPFAGFWQRAQAKVIDWFLLFACLLPFDLVFGTSLISEGDGHRRSTTECILVFAVFCLYSAAMESSKRQATLGKRALGLIVSDSDGNRLSFGRALLRAVAQFTVLGYLLAAFSERKQAFHDLIADTEVTPGTL